MTVSASMHVRLFKSTDMLQGAYHSLLVLQSLHHKLTILKHMQQLGKQQQQKKQICLLSIMSSSSGTPIKCVSLALQQCTTVCFVYGLPFLEDCLLVDALHGRWM